jgi:hypothetical protein
LIGERQASGRRRPSLALDHRRGGAEGSRGLSRGLGGRENCRVHGHHALDDVDHGDQDSNADHDELDDR